MIVRQKSYMFRLYPNQEQKQLFAKTFGCSRAIWNMMLADKIKLFPVRIWISEVQEKEPSPII